MSDDTPECAGRDGAPSSHLPDDVAQWLSVTLKSDETLSASLYADIAPDGRFGERWAFLTNQRLFVLAPNGSPKHPEKLFEMAVADVEDALVRDYITSSALILQGRDRGHEVARFSFASRIEATDLCHALKEMVRQRKEGEYGAQIVPPPPPMRPLHRCSKCGRALRRTGEICSNCIDRRRMLLRLAAYVLPYKWQAALGMSLTLAMTGLNLVPIYLTKVLVDDVLTQGNLRMLQWIVVLLILSYIGRAAAQTIRTYVMEWLGNRVLFDLQVQVFDHLSLLRLNYYNQRQTGQIMSRVTSDIQRLQNFIAHGFQDMLVNFVTTILIAGLLLFLNVKLFFLALAPVPIILFTTYLFGQRLHRLYHRIWRRMAVLNAILADTIPGIRVVKCFAQEAREAERFSERSADLLGHQLRIARISSLFYPFLGLMTGLGTILVFAIGGYMALSGTTTVGVLVAFTGYLRLFYQPIQQLGTANNQIQHCATSAERVFEILDTDTEPVHRTDGVLLDPLQGKVEFRDVRFSYEPGKYALDGVSFTINAGEMIGLVGPSGAGKSTLVHLITRFYDVDEGEILIDGHPIENLALKRFREQIGVVLQEPYLFYGTLWENIAYAKPDASADEIIAAARAAYAHEFILNQPDGYDTMVGERGQTLSGGERQRISIARAILRNPRILILDEATASVDTETEVMIQMALERLVQNRTTFAIAHRLTTLRKANRLLVMERGRVAEMGTHEELLNTGGLYSRLCAYQAEMSKTRAL